jgi:hypothetical protein
MKLDVQDLKVESFGVSSSFGTDFFGTDSDDCVIAPTQPSTCQKGTGHQICAGCY